MRVLVPLTGLVLILANVLYLELPHALNLVQVHHEALLVAVVGLDALSAENGQVVRTVEVLHSLLMLLAHLLLERCLIVVVEVKRDAGQDGVLGYHLVQDVDIQGEALSTL